MGKGKSGKSVFQSYIENNMQSLKNEINNLIKEYPIVDSLKSITVISKTAAIVKFKLRNGAYIKTEIRKCSTKKCIKDLRIYLNKYFINDTLFINYMKNHLNELKTAINILIMNYQNVDSLESITLISNKKAKVKFKLKSGKNIETEIKKCNTNDCINELRSFFNQYFTNKIQFKNYIEHNLVELEQEINNLLTDYPYIDSLESIRLISETAASVKFILKIGKNIEIEIRKCNTNRCIKDIKNYLNKYFLNDYKKLEKSLLTHILTIEDYKEIEDRINNMIENKIINVKVSTNIQVFYNTKKQYTINFYDLIDIMDYFEIKFTENNSKEEIIEKRTKEQIYESISKKILTKLKNVKIESPKDTKIKKIAEKIYNEYKSKNDLILNTKKYKSKEINCSHSLLEISKIEFNTKEFTITTINGEVNVFYKPNFKRYNDIVHSESFKIASNILKTYIKNSKYNMTNFKGSGFWFGNTTFFVNNPKWENSYPIEINYPYNEDMNANDWAIEIKEKIKSNIKKIEKDIKEERKKTYQYTAKYRNNFLARDIVEFIYKNEEYITENAVIQYMRGNKVQLNTVIHELQNFVAYKNYLNKDIAKVISSLIKDNIIEEWEYKGTYGKFYTLHLANNKYKQILANVKESDVTINPFSKKTFTDFEATKIFFDYEKKTNLSIKEYVMLFYLTSAKGFLIRYYDEYVTVLQNAPKEVKKFWKMKIDIEEDKFMKNFLKEIIKNSKVETID